MRSAVDGSVEIKTFDVNEIVGAGDGFTGVVIAKVEAM